MKVIVIGGVAAGPKAAARIKRVNPDASVTLIEKSDLLSYAGCGLPYYIAGMFDDENELMSTPVGTIRNEVFFKNVKDFTVLTKTLCTGINRDKKTVTIKKSDGKTEDLSYDQLVLATGADAFLPPFPGKELNNVYKLKDVHDAVLIKKVVKEKDVNNAVIIGGGLIGLETAEALSEMGCKVTIIELLPHIMSLLDKEMALLLERYMKGKGINIMTETKVVSFAGESSVSTVITDKEEVPADLVVVAVGVKPNVDLAADCGLELSSQGAIKVNKKMQTSDNSIYAVGDCAIKYDIITGKECYAPLGSTANKEGRVAANNICGVEDEFPGIVKSAICRVFDFTVARTGLSEKEAVNLGFDVFTCHVPGPDKPHFMDNMQPLFLKLIADKKTKRLLGAQATGPGNAERRIDIAATAITAAMTVDQVSALDLTYAPPYSPALDNIIVGANVLRNKIAGMFESRTPFEVLEMYNKKEDFIFLDVRSPKEIEMMSIQGTTNIPLGMLRKRFSELDNNKKVVVFCKISLRGYEAALILKQQGFKEVLVMDGGILMWPGEKIVQV